MANIALYRKYRSRDLNELIGQQHIATALENALKNDRISHAYLFTGPRGVGKTSTARILARRVNALSLEQAENHLDIIEIDAASNRRIDEVRDLREKVHSAPTSAKYKVYIIDEVHMLTNEAFNALLKTLEEPPAHVIFILATTEPHKLPETIISRTQRYSFRPVDVATMATHLKTIATKEKIKIDQPALELIAIAAEGSFRDSISLLDQLGNLGKGAITAELVSKVLGLADNQAVAKMCLAMAKGDTTSLLKLIDTVLSQGMNINQLLQQLLRYLQKVMRLQLGMGENSDDATKWLAENTSATTLAAIIQKLTTLVSNNLNAIALEAAMVSIALAGQPQKEQVVKVAAEPAPVVKEPTVSKVKPTKVKPSTKSSEKLEHSEDKWARALTHLKSSNNSLYAIVRSGESEFNEEGLHLRFRFQFHRRTLEQPKNRALLDDALVKAYGQAVPVRTSDIPKAKAGDIEPPKEEREGDKDAIDSALQILGGEIVNG